MICEIERIISKKEKNVFVSKHNIQKLYWPRETEKISILSGPSMAGPDLTAND